MISRDSSDTFVNTDPNTPFIHDSLRGSVLRVYGSDGNDTLKLYGEFSTLKLSLGSETDQVPLSSVTDIDLRRRGQRPR